MLIFHFEIFYLEWQSQESLWWCYSWHAKTDQSYSAAETNTTPDAFSYSNKTSCPPAGYSSIGQSIFEAIAGAWKFSPGRQNERSKCVKYSLRIFNKLCFFITRRRPESNHSLFFVSIRQEPILEASKAWPVEDIRESHTLTAMKR